MLKTMSLALVVAGTLVGGAAFAHPALKAATPSANGVVTPALKEIRLTFSEALVPSFSGATLTGLSGKAVVTGTAHADSKNKKIFVVPLKTSLAEGVYKLDWYAVAADTHRVQGSYRFTVKRAARKV